MGDKKALDEAAKDVVAALEAATEGKSEAAIAHVFVVLLALISGSPWFVATQPLVQRVLERINNKVGKRAVDAIAQEVATEEGFRRTAREVANALQPHRR